MRLHLPMYGQGTNGISLCQRVDHFKALYPFPVILRWNGRRCSLLLEAAAGLEERTWASSKAFTGNNATTTTTRTTCNLEP